MIYQNIDKILEENQVVEINAIDVSFDPAIHQAVMTEKVEGKESNIVIEVLRKDCVHNILRNKFANGSHCFIGDHVFW